MGLGGRSQGALRTRPPPEPTMRHRRPRPSLALSSALLLSTPLFAAAPPRAHDELEGEDLSELLAEIRAEKEVPGLVSMVILEGEVLAWGAAGVRVAGEDEPMSIHDPIHLGSCSKAMTSTLAATLVEAELLRWESTLGELLPEVAALHQDLAQLEGSAVETRREILTRVLQHAPQPPSPTGYDYSNFGYMTAGMMMEAVTRKPYEELMVERLFTPQKMESAGIGSPHGEGVPVGHRLKGKRWEPLPPGPGGALHRALGPAGLLHSNLEDWGRFLAEHVRGEKGESEFLSVASYERMHADLGSGYGAGWLLGRHRWGDGEAPSLAHNGSDGTWHSLCLVVPEAELIVMSAANASNTEGDSATRLAQNLMLRCAGFMD